MAITTSTGTYNARTISNQQTIRILPYAIMTALAALAGAGVSFAPLYERIWGGMMLHPACPVMLKTFLYRSNTGGVNTEYGACVTSPVWLSAVTALAIIMMIAFEIAMFAACNTARPRTAINELAGNSHQLLTLRNQQTIVWLAVAAISALAILALNGNLFNLVLWAITIMLWLVMMRLQPSKRTPIARTTMLAIQTGMMPVFITEYALSEEINISGGVIIACIFTLFAWALAWMQAEPRELLAAQQSPNPVSQTSHAARFVRIMPCASALAIGWLIASAVTYRYSVWTRTDFCPALAANGNALVASCIGGQRLAILHTVVSVLPFVSLACVLGVLICAVCRRRSAATTCCLLATASAMIAFVIAFTLV